MLLCTLLVSRVYNKKSVEPPIPAYKHCVESNVTSGAIHVRKRCKISRNFLVYLSVTYSVERWSSRNVIKASQELAR